MDAFSALLVDLFGVHCFRHNSSEQNWAQKLQRMIVSSGNSQYFDGWHNNSHGYAMAEVCQNDMNYPSTRRKISLSKLKSMWKYVWQSSCAARWIEQPILMQEYFHSFLSTIFLVMHNHFYSLQIRPPGYFTVSYEHIKLDSIKPHGISLCIWGLHAIKSKFKIWWIWSSEPNRMAIWILWSYSEIEWKFVQDIYFNG